MKKILLAASIIAFASMSYAQLIPGFSIGPKIGASFSKFTTDQSQIQEDIKSSFHYGAFARFGKKVYFQPEILINTRKGTLKDDNNSGISGSIKLNSVDVPLLLGARLIDVKAANIRIMAGPVASIAVNKTIMFDNWENPVTKDDIKNANWGLQFGAGADLLMFTVDLRYEIGLNDISKLNTFDLKNNMFTIGVGWKIL